jgi:hypothetical protein
MTNPRISPSGPLVNSIFQAEGSLGSSPVSTQGAFRSVLGDLDPTPNPVVESGDDSLILPKGKYLLDIFGRFGNAGSTQTIWSLRVGNLTQWSWVSQPGSSNEWISRFCYFEVAEGAELFLQYTNLADSAPALFAGRYTLVRIG